MRLICPIGRERSDTPYKASDAFSSQFDGIPVNSPACHFSPGLLLVELASADAQPALTATSCEQNDPSRWVDEHGDVLYRYALERVRKPDVAQDLVQETFLAAVRTHDRFRGRIDSPQLAVRNLEAQNLRLLPETWTRNFVH